jgi:dTDP-4-amino-4,6-dideoxygalactose transaminase/glycosyltransferase involved in cell wall biosynthesis
MDILFGDLAREYQELREEVDAAISRVLCRGWFVLGQELEAFERAFAEYVGASYCVGAASGTEAIALALMACGVGRDDEVITVSHTAIPTVNAISMVGARPVFVDIHPDTCLMDVGQVEAALSPRTRAILPVHLYGQCVDMDPLLALAARYNIPVIEDCAQAHGATYRGRKAGTMGTAGAFSFYPSKNLGCYGDGGAVVTNDAAIAEKLRMLRNCGQCERYHHELKGLNSRLDELQASILSVKLHHLDRWNSRRRAIAKRYTDALTGLSVQPPTEAAYGQHMYHLYVIQTAQRDPLQTFLAKGGIKTQLHYPTPVHLQPAYAELGYRPGSLPVTEAVVSRILSLPLYPQLTDEEIDRVSKTLRAYLRPTPIASALEPQTPEPLVTVIVPCYNHARFVVECLESVRQQTYRNIQLIIMDDCSKDNSVAVIRDWIRAHDIQCLFIAHERNAGLCKTLNEALSHAEGKYIAGIAADDVWLPDKLAHQVAEMERLPKTIGVLYSDAYLIDADGNLLPQRFIESIRTFERPPEGNVFRELIQKNWIPVHGTLIRRSCYEQVGLYDESLSYEDLDMWLRIARCYQFAYSSRILAKYRVLPTSMSRATCAKVIASDIPIGLKYLGHDPETDRVVKRHLVFAAEILYKVSYPKHTACLWKTLRYSASRREFLHHLLMCLCALCGLPHERFRRLETRLDHTAESLSEMLKRRVGRKAVLQEEGPSSGRLLGLPEAEGSPPLVTAIVPCYNHERFVIECLESVRQQTYRNVQLIIMDDASQDHSVAVIRAWIKQHQVPCTFIAHERNVGICKTLNEALAHAKGKYIAQIDSDDVWLPDKLAHQVEEMERLPETVGVLYADASLIDADGKLLPQRFIEYTRKFEHPPEGDIFRPMIEGCWIAGTNTLIRRACFDRVGKYDETLWSEDVDMWLRITKCFEFKYAPRVVAKYRILPTSMSRTTTPGGLESLTRLCLKYLGEDPQSDPVLKKHLRALGEAMYKIKAGYRKQLYYVGKTLRYASSRHERFHHLLMCLCALCGLSHQRFRRLETRLDHAAESLTKLKRRGVSVVILLTLLLQVAAVVNPFVKVFDDWKEFLWPFLDYPMFSQPHFEGVQARHYRLIGLLDDGTQASILPSSLGLDVWQFEAGVVRALLRKDRDALGPYVKLYHARQGTSLAGLRLENHPWTISKNGASPAPINVLAEVRL